MLLGQQHKSLPSTMNKYLLLENADRLLSKSFPITCFPHPSCHSNRGCCEVLLD